MCGSWGAVCGSERKAAPHDALRESSRRTILGGHLHGSLAPAHFLAVGARYINCVCDYALLFEDPSVENRRPTPFIALSPLPCASCALLSLV
jgi:hypothetical protein